MAIAGSAVPMYYVALLLRATTFFPVCHIRVMPEVCAVAIVVCQVGSLCWTVFLPPAVISFGLLSGLRDDW